MKTIALALALAAMGCKGSHKASEAPPIDPTPITSAVRALADRACGCNNDPGCVKFVRADWDAGKRVWAAARKRFGNGPAVVYDTDVARMRACGDAAGVTFWLEL